MKIIEQIVHPTNTFITGNYLAEEGNDNSSRHLRSLPWPPPYSF